MFRGSAQILKSTGSYTAMENSSQKIPYHLSDYVLGKYFCDTGIRQGWLPENGRPIALAVSGGGDSLALLWLFRKFYAGNVTAIHINHGIRGNESDDDERFTAMTAKNLGAKVAVITNLAPDHIDWHGSYEAYVEAKSRVLTLRDPNGWGIIQDRDYDILRPTGKIITLSWDEKPAHDSQGHIFMDKDRATLTINGESSTLFTYTDTTLIGSHNLENVAMSLCAMLLCNPFATGGPLPRITGTHCLSACGEVSRRDGGVIRYNQSYIENFLRRKFYNEPRFFHSSF